MKKLLKVLVQPYVWLWRSFLKLSRNGKYIVAGSLLLVGVVSAASQPSKNPLISNPTSPQQQNKAQPTQTSQLTPEPATKPIGARTKTSGCAIANSLQDKACTPGAVFAGVTKAQICMPGYSSSVRNVSDSTKNEVYDEYGITSHVTGQYEVDHLVSLELGGSNDISNLWPEPADPVPGFHQKDSVENSLHDKVCSGVIALTIAQSDIADNWLTIYNATYGSNQPQAAASSPAPAPNPSLVPTPASGGVVKLSTTGICHAPGDAYYDRTTNYTPYPSMDACVAAGGRPSER
ncbi:MAG: HNH endonuclease signature motif containing protein [Candidatus Saccharimonadia bacterium]